MKYINVILTIAILILAVILVKIIYDPIKFEKISSARYDDVEKKLKKIKALQFAYKDLKGHFADNFDSLLHTIKNDTFVIIKVTGNPDDTTQVILRDTFYIPVRDSLFPGNSAIESIRYIPHSKKKQFIVNAGEIILRNVKVAVFEVIAPNTAILHDLNLKYYDKRKAVILGSMMEANYGIIRP